MTGVKPLTDREKLRPPSDSPRSPTPREPERMRFQVERRGERIEGRAPGIDREHLRRLRTGAVRVDSSVDVHGLEAAAARRAVRETLSRGFDSGARCILVVHGRGLHSRQGPTLKDALPGWLEAPPIGATVMAFASAAPDDGGTGATYVLLRRSRRREKPTPSEP
jgi:DNA-nicking Smr family endonuclease